MFLHSTFHISHFTFDMPHPFSLLSTPYSYSRLDSAESTSTRAVARGTRLFLVGIDLAI